MRFFAVITQYAHQALGQNSDEAGGKQEGFNAHITQAGYSAHRSIGMQGGEYQVASQGCLHRNLYSFQITDFTDHHHVWILSQNSTQATGKGHVHLGVYLGLTDTIQVILDGVFHSEDIAAFVIEPGEARVKRGGLT